MGAPKILIADDAAFVREILSQILTKHGFDVVAEAQDGQEIVDIASKQEFDLIIMDIVMPVKSGIEASREILEKKPGSLIVACSTESSEPMVVKALEAGCVDFITKPFEIEPLIQTIQIILNKKGGA